MGHRGARGVGYAPSPPRPCPAGLGWWGRGGGGYVAVETGIWGTDRWARYQIAIGQRRLEAWELLGSPLVLSQYPVCRTCTVTSAPSAAGPQAQPAAAADPRNRYLLHTPQTGGGVPGVRRILRPQQEVGAEDYHQQVCIVEVQDRSGSAGGMGCRAR